MFKDVEVTFTEVEGEKERMSRIAQILTEGVYSYLKKGGYLKEDISQKERIKNLLDNVREVIDRDEDIIEED
ncbi:MAG: hypothetical protein V1872_14530 [bacterium]